jgi:hypothetical protein
VKWALCSAREIDLLRSAPEWVKVCVLIDDRFRPFVLPQDFSLPVRSATNRRTKLFTHPLILLVEVVLIKDGSKFYATKKTWKQIPHQPPGKGPEVKTQQFRLPARCTSPSTAPPGFSWRDVDWRLKSPLTPVVGHARHRRRACTHFRRFLDPSC